MSRQSGSTDYWRKFFDTANGDIFEVIHAAITVAVEDCPKEFKTRRDEIAEKLFTCRLPRCLGCDGVEVKVDDDEGDDVKGSSGDGKENNNNHNNNNNNNNKGSYSTNVLTPSDLNGNQVSCISYNEAEALTDIIEEERLIIEDVFRIKEVLLNSEDVSSSVLFDSLRRLELMDVTMQTLQTTSIGTAVSALRKHPRKEIAKLARNLVKSWKTLISEWIAATEAAKVSNDSPDSVKPSLTDEEECGLASPPLDEGLFFASDAFAPEATSMEFSKFFDGLDDDGNLDGWRNDDGNAQNVVSEPRVVQRENSSVQNRKPQYPREQTVLPKDKHEPVIRQIKPSDSDLGCRKPLKGGFEQKVNNEVKFQEKLNPTRTQKKAAQGEPDKSRATGNPLDQKLENAKRKLHQGYQQAENAKKQRTIQVMDLQDIPKQSFGNNSKNSQTRPGSHNNRHWANGRR